MSPTLAVQLILATVMVIVTVLVHLFGLGLLLAGLRLHARLGSKIGAWLSQVLILLVLVLALFVFHSIEIWMYAALYLQTHALGDLEQALYFSTAAYTTLGSGDVTLSKSWRILGAIEGANGLILLGWSTAFFVSVLSRIRALEADWPAHRRN